MTTEALTRPEHYSESDMVMIEQIKEFLQAQESITDNSKRISQAALARMGRVAEATLSRILNLRYPTTPSRQLKATVEAMKNDKNGLHDLSKTCATTIYKLVFAVCKNAREQRNFGIVSGYVGLGKTHALKDYQSQHNNTFLVEVDPTFTQKALVDALEIQILARRTNGSLADRVQSLCNALLDTDSLIIYDEAETLKDNVLHLIRRIRDKARVGAVLAGTEVLTGKIMPVHGAFDQIRSRVGFWPETMRSLKFEDVKELTEAYLGESVSEEAQIVIWHLCSGSARMLSENLIPQLIKFRPQYKKPGDPDDVLPEITRDMVKSVARQTLQITTGKTGGR